MAEALAYVQRNPPTIDDTVARMHKHYITAHQLAIKVFVPMAIINKWPCSKVDNGDVVAATTNLSSTLLIQKWVAENHSSADFDSSVGRVADIATTSNVLYDLAEAVWQTASIGVVLNIQIRAINMDLNRLELWKADVGKDTAQILAAERELAPRYRWLASVLTASVSTTTATNGNDTTTATTTAGLAREAILTAFSLHPTVANFELVKAHRTPLSADFSALCSITGNVTTCGSHYDPMTTPQLHSNEMSTVLCQDLAVVIAAPRIKSVSWLMEWSDMEQVCQRLIHGTAKIELVRQTVATANDHLEFLSVDYDRYKHLPAPSYPGIEKGYEMFYHDDDEDDADEVNINSDILRRRTDVENVENDSGTDSSPEARECEREQTARRKRLAAIVARTKKRQLNMAMRAMDGSTTDTMVAGTNLNPPIKKQCLDKVKMKRIVLANEQPPSSTEVVLVTEPSVLKSCAAATTTTFTGAQQVGNDDSTTVDKLNKSKKRITKKQKKVALQQVSSPPAVKPEFTLPPCPPMVVEIAWTSSPENWQQVNELERVLGPALTGCVEPEQPSSSSIAEVEEDPFVWARKYWQAAMFNLKILKTFCRASNEQSCLASASKQIISENLMFAQHEVNMVLMRQAVCLHVGRVHEAYESKKLHLRVGDGFVVAPDETSTVQEPIKNVIEEDWLPQPIDDDDVELRSPPDSFSTGNVIQCFFLSIMLKTFFL